MIIPDNPPKDKKGYQIWWLHKFVKQESPFVYFFAFKWEDFPFVSAGVGLVCLMIGWWIAAIAILSVSAGIWAYCGYKLKTLSKKANRVAIPIFNLLWPGE